MEIGEIKMRLESLISLQDDHIRAFDTDVLPDIEGQMAQREKEFSRLKKNFDRLLPELAGMDPETGSRIKIEIIDHIQELLTQSRRLESKVREHKTGLEKSMKRVNHGKRAMRGYGSPALVRSRVIRIMN